MESILANLLMMYQDCQILGRWQPDSNKHLCLRCLLAIADDGSDCVDPDSAAPDKGLHPQSSRNRPHQLTYQSITQLLMTYAWARPA